MKCKNDKITALDFNEYWSGLSKKDKARTISMFNYWHRKAGIDYGVIQKSVVEYYPKTKRNISMLRHFKVYSSELLLDRIESLNDESPIYKLMHPLLPILQNLKK